MKGRDFFMRNANGMGSVYSLSTKRNKRKLRKPWVARVSINNHGEKQKQKIIGYFETKIEAIGALMMYNNDPQYVKNSEITIDIVFKMYIKEHSEKVSETRIKNIKSQYKKNFDPIKDVTIQSITPLMLQNFMDSINKSSATKLAVKSLLKGIFKYALKLQIIKEDYSSLAEVGKREAVITRKVFSHDEIEFLYKKSDELMATHLLILIYTGMRINEYLSLELKDYDIKEYTIRTGSKTEAGKNRLIPIHSKIRLLLYKVLIDKENDVTYAVFRKQFTKYLEKYEELDTHTIHDTRHTFASMLSTAGANDVAITKIIGHTDIATTNKIYTHKDIFELRQTVELLQ